MTIIVEYVKEQKLTKEQIMEIEEARKKPEIMHFLLHCFGLYVIDTVPAPAVHSSCIAPSKAYFIRQARITILSIFRGSCGQK